MDKDLIELKEQVAKATGWDLAHMDLTGYLLEKLPLTIKKPTTWYFFMLTVGNGLKDERYMAKYEDVDEGQLVAEFGSNPLKALLKLTLALHEAGELK